MSSSSSPSSSCLMSSSLRYGKNLSSYTAWLVTMICLVDGMYNLDALVLRSDAKPRLIASTALGASFPFSRRALARCIYALHPNGLNLERSFFSPYSRPYGVFLMRCLYVAFLQSFPFTIALNQKGAPRPESAIPHLASMIVDLIDASANPSCHGS